MLVGYGGRVFPAGWFNFSDPEVVGGIPSGVDTTNAPGSLGSVASLAHTGKRFYSAFFVASGSPMKKCLPAISRC